MSNSLACWVPYKEINFYVPTGYVTYCCKHHFRYVPKLDDFEHGKDFLNNNHLNDLKKDLLDGQQIDICRTCWKSENNNEQSWRQTEGVIPEKYNNIEALQSSDAYYDQVALYFDNTCDMKCVYCGPGLSSKWEAEQTLVQQGKVQVEYKRPIVEVNRDKEIYNSRIQKIHEFLEELGKNAGKKQDCINLTILGGEPLLSPEIKDSKFLKYIDSFFKYANKDFQLIFTIHSNGNTPKKVLDRFLNDVKLAKENYKNLQLKIIISIDTIGTPSEYIRSGSNWITVDSNINTYYNSDAVNQLGFSPTLTLFSIPTLPEFIDYYINLSKTYDSKINMSVGVAFNPPHMNPYILTKEFSHYIELALDKINNNSDCFTDISLKLWQQRLSNLLDSIKEKSNIDKDTKSDLQKFLDYTIIMRNQNVYDYIPEIRKLL